MHRAVTRRVLRGNGRFLSEFITAVDAHGSRHTPRPPSRTFFHDVNVVCALDAIPSVAELPAIEGHGYKGQ